MSQAPTPLISNRFQPLAPLVEDAEALNTPRPSQAASPPESIATPGVTGEPPFQPTPTIHIPSPTPSIAPIEVADQWKWNGETYSSLEEVAQAAAVNAQIPEGIQQWVLACFKAFDDRTLAQGWNTLGGKVSEHRQLVKKEIGRVNEAFTAAQQVVSQLRTDTGNEFARVNK